MCFISLARMAFFDTQIPFYLCLQELFVNIVRETRNFIKFGKDENILQEEKIVDLNIDVSYQINYNI